MADNKYLGLAMAMVGSFAIGTSSVITKMGLTSSADGTASTDNMVFLRNSMWWAGMGALVVGEVANFGAYTFAPPTMVTPLGALSVIVAAVFASFLFNECLGHLGCVGRTLCILGSSIIVLHAPEDQQLETLTQFPEYAIEPGAPYCPSLPTFQVIGASPFFTGLQRSNASACRSQSYYGVEEAQQVASFPNAVRTDNVSISVGACLPEFPSESPPIGQFLVPPQVPSSRDGLHVH
ncbi:magnesium transporter NIPA-domain-containing protein [Mycena epipterygia]|nr:magnesium transporter NIPA-domain-containing protein [Mycena epipterygia]